MGPMFAPEPIKVYWLRSLWEWLVTTLGHDLMRPDEFIMGQNATGDPVWNLPGIIGLIVESLVLLIVIYNVFLILRKMFNL